MLRKRTYLVICSIALLQRRKKIRGIFPDLARALGKAHYHFALRLVRERLTNNEQDDRGSGL